ncbi:hypothetical protein CVD28_01430 [Bacillus sp. M6-12]|uniref:hypothetical protein n=1 Tax=Bacillus sp. M6-12 TaxID=2054166 RepID=UPI000C77EA94|nr:hypothetical protein [Bacillus sp. M6-12]PLS19096.1 hypothetical protein CVD28_01430 [Bacillus sp. M6-12]
MGFFKNLFQDNSPNPYKAMTDEQYQKWKKIKKGSYEELSYLEKIYGSNIREYSHQWVKYSYSKRDALIKEADGKAYALQQKKNKYEEAKKEMMNKFSYFNGRIYSYHTFCEEYKEKIREFRNLTVIEDDIEREKVDTDFSGILHSIYISFTTPDYATITGHANAGTFHQPNSTKEVLSVYPNVIRDIKVSDDTIMIVTYFTYNHQVRRTLYILKK